VKKLINDSDHVVRDALVGFAAAHADLVRVDHDSRLCLRRVPLPAGQVALVSGGGSGHEPLHAGFVGDGMLAAAVLGDVFASPTADQVLAAIAGSDSGGGVLLIVKNYTGDVLNFRLAAELAEDLGIDVRVVKVDDDVAVGERGGSPGRRGTAATLFVEKIVGALAARGAGLDQLHALAQRVVDRSRSVGVALTSCTTPMAGRPTFDLGDAAVEFGVGIHGEAGVRQQPLTPSAELADQMIAAVIDDLAAVPGTPVLLLTNGFGATPLIELYTLHADAIRALAERGYGATRHRVGSLVTSLDMSGASISVLALDDELTDLWDAPARTAALTQV
jgi:dihydroxyacetone kinase-like protein